MLCIFRKSESAINTTRQTVKLNNLNNYLARASTSSISIFKGVFHLRTKIMMVGWKKLFEIKHSCLWTRTCSKSCMQIHISNRHTDILNLSVVYDMAKQYADFTKDSKILLMQPKECLTWIWSQWEHNGVELNRRCNQLYILHTVCRCNPAFKHSFWGPMKTGEA